MCELRDYTISTRVDESQSCMEVTRKPKLAGKGFPALACAVPAALTGGCIFCVLLLGIPVRGELKIAYFRLQQQHGTEL